MCVPPFEQLAKRDVDYLQESILKRLHNHSFINILFYLSFDLHQTCMKSCVRLNVNTWLFAHLIILFFRLLPNVFSTALHTKLDLFHPLIFGVSHCIYSQPLDLMEIHLLCCTHGEERTILHDIVWDVFIAIARYTWFHVSLKQTHVLPPCAL